MCVCVCARARVCVTVCVCDCACWGQEVCWAPSKVGSKVGFAVHWVVCSVEAESRSRGLRSGVGMRLVVGLFVSSIEHSVIGSEWG